MPDKQTRPHREPIPLRLQVLDKQGMPTGHRLQEILMKALAARADGMISQAERRVHASVESIARQTGHTKAVPAARSSG